MITRKEILDFLKEKEDYLKSTFNLTKLGLFGSYALNQQHEASDIDLIVEFKPNTSDLHYKKQQIRLFVGSHFGKKVDLCREKYIKPYFRETILNSAIYV